MNNKVLLCNIPFYRLLNSHYNSINLGMAYTAASLNSRGFDSWIYNADFVPENNFGNFSDIIHGYENYVSFFQNENHSIWLETVEKILEFSPDIVGYSAYTANIKGIEIISRILRSKNSNIKQVIGGPHAILDSKIKNKLPNIDKVHSNDGEYFLNPLRVYYSVDDSPFPEREKIWGIKKEDKKYIDYSYIISSRGCPYSCKFCASPKLCNRKVAFRSLDSVIAEVLLLKNKYNVKTLYFLDDTLTANKYRAKQLFKLLIDCKVSWKCNTRLDCLDEEICELMKQSGCNEVKVGIESGSSRVLQLVGKNETKEKILKGIQYLKKQNIPITAYFMTGFPGETDEDLKQTIEFAREIDVEKYSLSIFSPYFGSQFYYDLIKQGFDFSNNWELFYHQNSNLIVNKNLSKNLIQEFLRLGDK